MKRLDRTPLKRGTRRERGAALITSLLCMTLLYALGLALLLSTTTDTLISTSYRASEEAFFAADAGVAVGRRAVAKAFAEQVSLIASGAQPPYRPDSQVLPDTESAPDAAFFRAVAERAAEIANGDERSLLPNGSKYQIEILAFEGGPTSTPVRNPRNGLEAYQYTYEMRSTGRSELGARSEVVERGELRTHLTAAAYSTRLPYSRYGTFFDTGNPEGNLVLVSGTFTGPVHTNSHFRFSSRNNVVFRGRVTQGEDFIEYDGAAVPIPEKGTKGIVVSDGAYKQDSKVPLPKNNFVQELAVINGSGYRGSEGETPLVDARGRVTPEALRDNLSDVHGRTPQVSGSDISPGVFVASTDGTEITGGGIYVNGDAQIALSTSGAAQVISVTQGTTTTTITLDYTSSTTTVSASGTTRTFTGVPMDRSLGPSQSKPGISLFVDGSVTSLSGPPAVNGQTGAAIAPQTAMTITAQRHVTVTGDVKYAEPIVASDGTPLPRANSAESVLGIFTNDGNVVLQPSPTHTDGDGASLEIDAAIAAFNADKSNDSGVEGAILYGVGSPARNAKLTIVGARLQSNIANIKYRTRQIFFDPRLDGGQFAPPFFPGIEITKTDPKVEINFPGERAVTIYANAWQRDERRRRSSDD